MKFLRPVITIVCLVAAFKANAGEQGTTKTKCVAIQPTNAESLLLQGTWEGMLVGDGAKQKITITITGNSLHFHRDKNFWFETTIALPEGKAPKQLHATIKDCAEKGSIGEVVKAFYKIADGTLTLATIGEDTEETPESFENAGTRYELRKIKPQENGIALPEVDATSDLLDLNELIPKQSGSANVTEPEIKLAATSRDRQNGLGSLALEGHELHASLKLRQIDDSIRHLPSGVLPPENPHLSTDADFVEAIARSGSQGRLDSTGIRSVLYAIYVAEKELGFYGFEAASSFDADWREAALRKIWAYNVRLDRARIHREGLVLVVVWTDGVSSECWEAVNTSVVKRLVAPAPSSGEEGSH